MIRLLPVSLAVVALIAAPAASQATLDLRLVSETNTTVTLGWDPQGNMGYVFYADGKRVSWTADPTRTTARFAKASTYNVVSLIRGPEGQYPPLPPPPVLGPFLDTDGGTCERTAEYIDAKACDTLSRARGEAHPGDTITVRAGVYGPQTLTTDVPVNVQCNGASFTSNWPAPSVQITSSGANVTFRDCAIGWLQTAGSNLVFENTDFGTFNIHAGQNITIRGGDVGPAISRTSPTRIDAHPVLPGTARDVLIDRVRFHDIGTLDPNLHTECLLVYGVIGLTVRNSTFFNCDSTGDLYITRLNLSTNHASHPVCEDVLVENNWFLDDTGYTAGPQGTQGSQTFTPQLENDCEIVFRSNTVSKRLTLLNRNTSCGPCNDPLRPVTVHGNYGSMTMQTSEGYTGGGNVWVHGPYGGTSLLPGDQQRTGDLQVVSQVNDLHLLPSSAAINQAAAFASPTDIDGEPRPKGAASDSGADEHS